MAKIIDLDSIVKDNESVKDPSKGFKKVEFIDLPQGQTIIRILSENVYQYYTHYVNGVYVKCLEDGCPICASNRKIFVENPNTFRDIKEWNRRTERYAMNVLDRTLVKICPNCKAENKKVNNTFPVVCKSCNNVITTVEPAPLNKVKILSKGVTLKDQLKAIKASVLDPEGTPTSLTKFDIALSVSGSGKETTITPVPLTANMEVVEIEESALFDLTKSVIELTADELVELRRGVSLKDIFAIRKVGKTSSDPLQAEADEAQKEIVNALMGNIGNPQS